MSDGIGCECFARSAGECCCEGVDWTPKEVVDLREEVARLTGEVKTYDEMLDEIGDALADVDYSGLYVVGIRVLKAELESAKAENVKLRENIAHLVSAGTAVVDRWDSPKWTHDAPHTGTMILSLRKAIDNASR